MTTVYFVVPDGIDDPAHPSGGNLYDRRISRGLSDLGWSVAERGVPGTWPRPDAAAFAVLADVMAAIPDGALVVVDGLIASAAAPVLLPAACRLRLVVLVHMPLGEESAGERAGGDPAVGGSARGEATPAEAFRGDEAAVLRAAAVVVTTSEWTRARLLELYALRPEAVHVAEPGVDAAKTVNGTASGGELLCVAAVAPPKGHDLLVAALTEVADLDWRCGLVGAIDRDPGFVERLRNKARAGGVGARIRFTGPLTGTDLDFAYEAADVLLVASRAETYGMVVTEALARGIPVIATAVGGVPGALGYGSGGQRPGLLIPADDADAMAAALRGWLTDPLLRRRLRKAALQRRETLTGWAVTSDRLVDILKTVAVARVSA